MEDEEEVMIMNYSEIDFPAPIHTKSEFQDESDYVGYEDCKEEFDLEQMLENGEVTPMETKCEDWEMLEAEICSENLDHSDRHKEQNELIIKHDDDDISDISLVAHNEDRLTETEALGTETNTDEATEEIALGGSPIRPRKKQSADGIDAEGAGTLSIRITDVKSLADGGGGSISHAALTKGIKCSSEAGSKTAGNNGLSLSGWEEETEDGLFKCTQSGCSFKTFNQMSFKGHSRAHQNTEIINCEHCSAAFPFKALLSHILGTHKGETESCPQCRQLVPTQLKAYHCCPKNYKLQLTKSFNCELCAFSSKYRIALNHHLLTHSQTDVERFNKKCEYCSNLMPIGMEKEHLQKCYMKKKEETDPSRNTYNCYHCSHATDCRSSFIVHTKKHLGKNQKIVKCEHCDYKSSKAYVDRHYYKQHADFRRPKGKIYQCDLCSYSQRATFKNRIIKHMKMHTSNTLIVKCDADHCSFKSFVWVVAWHFKRAHGPAGNDKTNNEEIDNSQGLPAQVLPRFSNTFKCKQCSYTSHLRAPIEKHEKTHLNGDPNEECPRCDYRSTNIALRHHMRLIHNLRKD